LRTWMDTTDDPLLAQTRRGLGIDQSSERPYELMVQTIDRRMFDPATEPEGAAAWRNAFAQSGVDIHSVFTTKPAPGRPAVVVIDQGMAKAVLDGGDEAVRRRALKILTHEYAHGQRDVLTSNNIGIGPEEHMASKVSGGGVYPETMVFSNLLNGMTSGEYGRVFDRVAAGQEPVDALYELVHKAAGPQAALALATIPPTAPQHEQPSEYVRPWVHEGESNGVAMYRNLMERVEPGRVAMGLTEVNPVVAKWMMENAMGAGIPLHQEIVEALIGRLEPGEDPARYRNPENW
jgi:hypothetical protein